MNLHFLMVMWLAISANAHAHQVTCLSLFAAIQENLSLTGFTDDYSAISIKTKPSLSLIAEQQDAQGDSHLVYELVGQSYGTYATTNGYDPQGDPRWYMEVVGVDVAPAWGFYLLDSSKLVQVPTRETWLKRKTRVSEVLVSLGYEPIEMGFYGDEHLVNGKVMLDVYNQKFIVDGEIPMAPGTNIPYLHDLSFHTGYILLNRKIWRASRARYEYFYHAVNFLREQISELKLTDQTRADELRWMVRSMRKGITSKIDSATGTVSSMVVEGARTGNLQKLSKIVHRLLLGEPEVDGGYAPSVHEQFLKWIVEVSEGKRAMSYEQATKLMASFDDSFVSSFAEFDAYAPGTINSEDLCRAVMTRRKEIREATLVMLAETAPSPLALLARPTPNKNHTPRSWWRRLLFVR